MLLEVLTALKDKDLETNILAIKKKLKQQS